MKTIEATAKSTAANTTYYSIAPGDKRAILNVLTEFLAVMVEEAQFDSEIQSAFWSSLNDLPRGTKGKNSVPSFVAGLIAQHARNPRRDFSARQLDGLDLLLPNICASLDCEDIQVIRL